MLRAVRAAADVAAGDVITKASAEKLEDLVSPGVSWKVVMHSIRTSKRPNPKVDYEYPEPRMFLYAFSVIDMQLLHGTRAATPGIASSDEAGWSIDVGFDKPQSAHQEWFTIAGLISAGR